MIPSEEFKINVYPMDFEEFCDATNYDYELFKMLYSAKNPIGNASNRKLMRDFRIYMAVGGMPQAVINAYINKKNMSEIDLIKKDLLFLRPLREENLLKMKSY